MHIPILTYHSIDASGSVISVAPQKFREQMEFLKRNKFPVVPLSLVAAWMRGEDKIPDGAVAITFDDGFLNFYESAFPVLQDCGFPATVFLVAGHCGGRNNWYGQHTGIPVMDLMGWDRISELSRSGVDFGSHTMNHPDLSRCSAAQAADEIAQSCEMIQKQTAKPPLFFAYPYGVRSEASADIVRRAFEGACSVIMDFADLKSDRFFLPRIDMYYFSRNDLFFRYGTTAFDYYVRFRAFLRSLRQHPFGKAGRRARIDDQP